MYKLIAMSDEGIIIMEDIPTQEKAEEFGKLWQESNGDDPRWQVVPNKATVEFYSYDNSIK